MTANVGSSSLKSGKTVMSALLYICLYACWYSGPVPAGPPVDCRLVLSSNLVHKEFLYRIQLLIKCHCYKTKIPPQMGRDCRLSDGREQEQPLKNPADSDAHTHPKLPGPLAMPLFSRLLSNNTVHSIRKLRELNRNRQTYLNPTSLLLCRLL